MWDSLSGIADAVSRTRRKGIDRVRLFAMLIRRLAGAVVLGLSLVVLFGALIIILTWCIIAAIVDWLWLSLLHRSGAPRAGPQ